MQSVFERYAIVDQNDIVAADEKAPGKRAKATVRLQSNRNRSLLQRLTL